MNLLLQVAVLALVLAAVVHAGGEYGRGEGKLKKVTNIWEPTIVHKTQKHYSKKVRSSKSRRDKYRQVNTRTQTNANQKVVSSDVYVKDNVKVEYPLEVLNVEHHNNHLTVKNVYPKHINTYVNRWKKVIKPQEGRTDSYSNSESREKIVHKTQVQNREKEVNLGVKIEPTQWVEVSKRYNNERRERNNNNYNNEGRERNNGNKYNNEWDD